MCVISSQPRQHWANRTIFDITWSVCISTDKFSWFECQQEEERKRRDEDQKRQETERAKLEEERRQREVCELFHEGLMIHEMKS